jgi:AraC-like DNA-binding protein
MSRIAVLRLAEPEQFEKNMGPSAVREVVTANGTYETRLTRIHLRRLWLRRGRKTLASVTHTALPKQTVPIIFLAHMNQQPMLNSGLVVHPGEIVSYAPGIEHHLRSHADYEAGTMTLPLEDFAAYGRALLGRELRPPDATRVVRPSSASMLRLMRLHKAASDLAADAPEILAQPEVAQALEEELVRSMITCLTEGQAVAASRAGKRPIMRRFEQALEAHDGELVFLSDLCTEIGVSERTLQLHCQEQLGISPHRYLVLRRMNMARRALANACSTQTNVTTIAVEHGFGELGRFSVQYRRLFGESPSETLRRAPHEPRQIGMSALE